MPVTPFAIMSVVRDGYSVKKHFRLHSMLHVKAQYTSHSLIITHFRLFSHLKATLKTLLPSVHW